KLGVTSGAQARPARAMNGLARGEPGGAAAAQERPKALEGRPATPPRPGTLRALSAEEKARVGQLIRALAQERRDKEAYREQLGVQEARLRDLEYQREQGREQAGA
ncbi:unnamed protein product, partial [Prorocentrum cordatum]